MSFKLCLQLNNYTTCHNLSKDLKFEDFAPLKFSHIAVCSLLTCSKEPKSTSQSINQSWNQSISITITFVYCIYQFALPDWTQALYWFSLPLGRNPIWSKGISLKVSRQKHKLRTNLSHCGRWLNWCTRTCNTT